MQVIKYSEIRETDQLDRIKQIFFTGGIMIYPTDTLYGMGGHFFSPEVISKLDQIKQRSDNPYSVAVSGPEMISRLVRKIPLVFQRILEVLLPGKLTLLFQASEKIDRQLLKNSDKIGIRIPDKPLLLNLIEHLGSPLITTSVNRSGASPLNNPESIRREFLDQPIDLLIDEGDLGDSRGSTILDLTVNPPRVLREGDHFSRISEALKSFL